MESIDFLIEEQKEEITLNVNREIDKLEKFSQSFSPFRLSYEDMKEKIKEINGIEALQELLKYCEVA